MPVSGFKRGLNVLANFVALGLALGAAHAGTPEKDKSWDALIEEAKKLGGGETRLDRSVSYVLQRPDGSYVSFTRLLAAAKRSVCLISKDQHTTACVDWDTGKTSYGEHADAASPWKVHDGPSLDDVAADQPGPLDGLKSFLLGFAKKKRTSER